MVGQYVGLPEHVQGCWRPYECLSVSRIACTFTVQMGIQHTPAQSPPTTALLFRAIPSRKGVGPRINAINASGPENAVTFCNGRAEFLTDSSATAQNVSIRRVSDRPRNPANAADSFQRVQIEALRADLEGGIPNPYRLHEEEDIVTGFYPIVTNDMCLKCHGDKDKTINQATLSVLEELYPQDQATGYVANQLRGIWVVEMPRSK